LKGEAIMIAKDAKEAILAQARLVELFQEAEWWTFSAFPYDGLLDRDSNHSKLSHLLLNIKRALVSRLARAGLHIGCEYRDEAGGLIGIVNEVRNDGAGGSVICWDHGAGEFPTGVVGNYNGCDAYFCLPGSKAYDCEALVEVARDRVKDAEPATASAEA
jgi:hypothetical protein